ncbi:MAG: heavy-metal-associated domain-containing protein [Azoarcus sp.]|jgi:pseudouridine-5'-phosphate glycosidase|nr:heavy-metal-associated domain-containing protein [Azoarcus sp.]
MPLIASSIPGRIRIRHKTLAQAQHSEHLRATLLSLEGVSSVEANVSASSLIVRYDAAAVPAEEMESAVEEIVQATLDAVRGKRGTDMALNRAAKYTMLFSLAAALALAAKGARRGHVIAGGLFVAGLGAHLYFHRHKILG